MNNLAHHAKEIQVAVTELRMYEKRKESIQRGDLALQVSKAEALKVCDEQIAKLHAKIEEEVSACYQSLELPKSVQPTPVPQRSPAPTIKKIVTPEELPPAPARVEAQLPPAPKKSIPVPADFSSRKFQRLSKKEKEQYIHDLQVNEEELEDFLKYQALKAKIKTEIKKEDYTIYTPNEWGVVANKHVKKYTDQLVRKYPQIFQPLFEQFQRVDMPILSRSYVSVMLFFTAIALPTLLVSFLVLNLVFKLNIILVVFLSLVATALTLVGFYFYPASLQGDRRKKIKKDLPFALVHMSAVAGSGAHPISIFELLVESEEYDELKKEIRKILNYVNLFGYNLSTALRNVAATTASQELKELLNGLVSTIETGGDLKGYLKEKADDALNTYRLDRKKEVEAISTFAEIYTAILIAAPLLLIVTLAIINTIGGQLGGVSVKLLAQVGILAVLPLLNVGYMVFIRAQSANL